MAASRPPGLQGWVTVGKSCQGRVWPLSDQLTLTINGTGGNGAEPPNTGTRGRKGKQLDPRWKEVRLWLPGTEPVA